MGMILGLMTQDPIQDMVQGLIRGMIQDMIRDMTQGTILEVPILEELAQEWMRVWIQE